MHVSESFKVLLQEDKNIFYDFTNEEYKLVRKRMINCILATDMVQHFSSIPSLQKKLESYNIKNGQNVEKLIDSNDKLKKFENQQNILNFLIHSSDISNPAKPINVYDEWVDRVFIEFFNQGDKEKEAGFPISYLCDRSTVDINTAQIGFINGIVLPTFEILINITPNILTYYETIKTNLKIYEEKDKEKKKSELKLKN
jgi:cAMP-specific phosphodiesterase 4